LDNYWFSFYESFIVLDEWVYFGDWLIERGILDGECPQLLNPAVRYF
jgi:hypothetical protein